MLDDVFITESKLHTINSLRTLGQGLLNEIAQNAVHLAAFDQESIVADGGGQLGHGQQVAQVARDMLLLVIRVQNIGIYADDHGGYLRRSQSFVEAAAAAANI